LLMFLLLYKFGPHYNVTGLYNDEKS